MISLSINSLLAVIAAELGSSALEGALAPAEICPADAAVEPARRSPSEATART